MTFVFPHTASCFILFCKKALINSFGKMMHAERIAKTFQTFFVRHDILGILVASYILRCLKYGGILTPPKVKMQPRMLREFSVTRLARLQYVEVRTPLTP